MRKISIIGSAVFSLILGIALPAHSQQDQKNEKQDQHKQQQEAKKQAKHDQQHAQQPQNQDHQQQQAQQQKKQDQGHQQEQRIQQMQNQERQQEQAQQQQQRQDQSRQQQRDQQQHNEDRHHQHPERNQDQQRAWQSTWQDHRATSWQSDHRNWRQRGGYNGYRIPQERYRSYFGPQHWFRISGRPFMAYGGYPRFQYEGYWITLLDPWPEYWSNDWYDNDDVYIDYGNDGYYMFNRRDPGVAIAISISM
jgi:hypothetical protein